MQTSEATFQVQIIKCSDRGFWYTGNIGEVFTVYIKEHSEGVYTVADAERPEGGWRNLAIEDVRKVKTVQEIEAAIAQHRASIDARHENNIRLGDDDANHMGLSAWSDNLTMQKLRTELALAQAGWMDYFDALFRNGKEVPAKIFMGKYGACWGLLDSKGKFTGEFYGDSRGPRSKLSKAGFTVGQVLRPARAIITGSGKGLAGCTSCFVTVIQVD